MKNILVTGGSGFIGSHTCLNILNKGYKVIVLDSSINSSTRSLEMVLKVGLTEGKDFYNQLYFVKGDIRDEIFIERVFKNFQKFNMNIDAVIHFAGLKSVSQSLKDPLLYWDNNVIGSINLFKSMQRNNCNTIVFSSSATIYGLNNNQPLNENSIKNPINPYGETKFVIEKILKSIYSGYENNWRIANLRYFNPIGAHSTGLLGEDLINPPNNIFPIICQVAIGLREKMRIFGSDWPTPDGTCIRDYVHIMDLAEAHTRTLEFLFSGNPQTIDLNIGTGKGTSVLNLIKTFERTNNCKINYKFTERRLGDASEVVANNELAFKLLNWAPKRTLSEMCIDGWKWTKLNPKGYENKSNFKKDKSLKIIELG